MKLIFKNSEYEAQVNENDGHCVVHRFGDHYGTKMFAHVGEKHPSQDWREVRLFGCPDGVRNAIINAWEDERKRRRESRVDRA